MVDVVAKFEESADVGPWHAVPGVHGQATVGRLVDRHSFGKNSARNIQRL